MKYLRADSGEENQESKKRKREWLYISILGLLFLVLSGVAFRLFDYSRDLPFEYSIFFFGLVNFNIILFLLLIFLIFRNIVKVFSQKRDGITGSSLKGKLIAAFVSFSFIPTTLMFFISVFYINNSFDKWFSEKNASVLKSALEVMDSYYVGTKKKNYHFANEIVSHDFRHLNFSDPKKIKQKLQEVSHKYHLYSVEYYPGLFKPRIYSTFEKNNSSQLPEISLEFRKKAIRQGLEASMIHHFAQGNLIRVIVPVNSDMSKRLRVSKLRGAGQVKESGFVKINAANDSRSKNLNLSSPDALVVSSYVPLSLISKIDDISEAYDEYRGTNTLSYPLKSIYLIILVLMTLVILLGATWFGFYLARQLSIPLELLGMATQQVSEGDYYKVDFDSKTNHMAS